MNEDRIDITDDDIRAARNAWKEAEAADPGSARAVRLYDSYKQLVSAQAQQIADDFRRRRRDG